METARRFSGQGGLLGTTKHRPWGQVSSWCSVHMSPATQDPPWSGREEEGRHCSGRPSPRGVRAPPSGSPTSFSARICLLIFTPRGRVWPATYRAPPLVQSDPLFVGPVCVNLPGHSDGQRPRWASVDLQSRAPASGGPPRRSRRAVPPRCVPSPVAKGLLVAVLLPCF